MTNLRKRDVTYLHAGELFFGRNTKTIETLLGSCITITLWHPVQRYAGICHFALPRGSAANIGEKLDARYAEDCMDLFESLANKRNLKLSDFEAKLFGGGNAFAQFSEDDQHDLPSEERQFIGDKNVAIAFQLLLKHGVPILEADVGEFGYRKVTFDMQTGNTESTFTAFGANNRGKA